MTNAYWCLLAVILFPYFFVVAAKVGTPGFNNHAPRDTLEKAKGWARRCLWVEQNSYEILPAFAAAVIVAHTMGAEQDSIDRLAYIFLASRIAYGACFVTDKATLRSLAWFAGMICVIGLFLLPQG